MAREAALLHTEVRYLPPLGMFRKPELARLPNNSSARVVKSRWGPERMRLIERCESLCSFRHQLFFSQTEKLIHRDDGCE
jgi:hypothetical protein